MAMDYYGYDPAPEELKLKQLLSQAQALRGTKMPQGQMVSGYYVAPSKTQNLLPLVNSLAADLKENQAEESQRAISDKAQQSLQQWLGAKPSAQTVYGAGDEGPTMDVQQPTDAQNNAWAGAGLRNPLSKALASASLTDNMVNAPIRAEKAADKAYLKEQDNRRFDADRAQRADLQQQRLDSQWQMLQSRLSNTNLGAEERLDLQRQALALRERMHNENLASREKIAGASNEAKVQAAQLKSALAGAGKPLSPSQMKILNENTETVARISDFDKDFSDDMTGPKGYLNAETGGKFFRDDPDAQRTAEWWRNFRAFDNIERHKLFGSALTAPEKMEWKRTTVSPLSSPEQVRTAIATRKRLAEKAFTIHANNMLANTAKDAVAASAEASGSPVLKKALGSTTVAPATQRARDTDRSAIWTQEWNAIDPSDPRAEGDYKALEGEFKRAGLPVPPRKKVGGSTGGWSIRKVE